jgi:hypothetical protein
MRKVNLKNYTVAGKNRDGTATAEPFEVREALTALCFIPAEGCKTLELLKRQKLAEKIAAAKDSILLEDAEWQRLRDALDATRGLGQGEIELVHRIVDAPEVKPKA